MNQTRIYLSPPNIGEEEKRTVLDSLESGWIAPVGPMLDQFEEDLSSHFNRKVLLLNSGTSALHLSLILVGVQQGDHVVTSSMTFAACANVIFYQHAVPVFIDSEEQTWNMDPQLLEEYLKKAKTKPKAIILTHLYGVPARISEVKSIADKHEITLIEDAAEALGSFHETIPLGSIGKFGVLSFNGNKIITTSGGGALICDNEAYKRGLHLATQANKGWKHYEHDEVGYNYRMSNVLAGLGRAQFGKIDRYIGAKQRINKVYRDELNNYLAFPIAYDKSHNLWLSTALMNTDSDPEELIKWLEKYNIESRRLWKPLHLHNAYKRFQFIRSGVCERIYNKGICLPSGTGLSETDQFRVIDSVKAFYETQ